MHTKVIISHVDSELCNACEMCVKVCKNHCYYIDDSKGNITAIFSDNNCDQCGECIRLCPSNAIILKTNQECKKEDFYVVINEDKCKACEECVKICPSGFEIIDDGKKIHSKKLICSCQGNLRCVFLCKEHAIEAKKY